MGGEDQEFFTAAHNAGFQIRQTERAVVVETVDRERQTYSFSRDVYRAYWCAASDVRRLVIAKGWWNAISWKAQRIPFFARRRADRSAWRARCSSSAASECSSAALTGGNKTAKAIGRAAAIGCAISRSPSRHRGEITDGTRRSRIPTAA